MQLIDKTVEVTRKKDIKFDGMGQYIFTIDKELVSDKDKSVYIGHFDAEKNESAPGVCVTNKGYCLKTATIQFPMVNFEHPQQRHFWDFVLFDYPDKVERPNIREVLVFNTGTKKLNRDISIGKLNIFNNNNGQKSEKYECMIIEPFYDKFKISNFESPLEKLDCIRQIINGIRQLMSAGIFSKASIVSHRDLKFQNVMVETAPDGKRNIKLIDFPSVKTNYPDADETDPNKTIEGPFSYNNTTPEDVLDCYEVTEKNDVFVLGCMLMEIFEAVKSADKSNPLHILFTKKGIDLANKLEECAALYKQAAEQYPHNASDKSWLEELLVSQDIYICWDNFRYCTEEFRQLFRDAVAIDPADRITLDEFDKRLEAIENCIKENPEACRNTTGILFIIDMKDINSNKGKYFEKIKGIMSDKWEDFEPVLVGYDWIDPLYRLQPSSGTIRLRDNNRIKTEDELLSAINSFSEADNEAVSKSSLKGCLYEALEYMQGKNFCSDVHIFTPVAPSEGNMCEFMLAKDTAAGATEIKTITAEDIIHKHPRFKFLVYTCSGKAENWYNCEFISASPEKTTVKYTAKKAAQPAEAVKKQEKPPVKAESKPKKPDEAPKKDELPFKIIITGTKN